MEQMVIPPPKIGMWLKGTKEGNHMSMAAMIEKWVVIVHLGLNNISSQIP
jgi:hypothetical protein